MRTVFAIAFCILISGWIRAQTISGRVTDELTRDALPYVQVSIVDTDIKTVTDINGWFTLKIESFPVTLGFRYFNYRDTVLNVTSGTPVLVILSPVVTNFDQITITPKEDPAYRIIRLAVKHKVQNNPMNKKFSYEAYNKFYMTLNLDSAELRTEEPDSVAIKLFNTLQKQYLFFSESVEERYHKSAVKDKSYIIYHRTSGFKDPTFAFTASELQPFSFYSDRISLGEIDYLNPISKAGWHKYDLRLMETRLEGKDSVFVIQFEPDKKTIDGLKGTCLINSNGYAIQYIEAQPILKSDEEMLIRIRQVADTVGGEWFPTELNTTVYMPSALGNMVAAGRTTIKNVRFNPDFQDVKFDHLVKEVRSDTIVVDLTFYRDSLTQKEETTYRIVDSISHEHNLEGKFQIMKSLITGRVPIKFVDLDVKNLMGFNDFEGYRINLGLYTNDRISKWFSVGGYGGYGFKDHRWKYGSTVRFNLSTKYQTFFEADWHRDIYFTGSVDLQTAEDALFSNGILSDLFRNRADYVESRKVGFGTRMFRHFRFLLALDQRAHTVPEDQIFTKPLSTDIARIHSNFNVTEISTEMRFLHNEKFVTMFGALISQGSDKPDLAIKYTRGTTLLDGEFEYNRLDLRLFYQLDLLRAGKPTLEVRGGYVDNPVPLSLNYNIVASYKPFTVSVPFGYETMRINEFFSQQYVSTIIQYNIGKLYRARLSAPDLVLTGKALFGSMPNRDHYSGFDFKVPEKGYYEAGLLINNLYLSGFQGLGIGGLYRMGYYAFDDWRKNLAVKLTLSYGI